MGDGKGWIKRDFPSPEAGGTVTAPERAGEEPTQRRQSGRAERSVA